MSKASFSLETIVLKASGLHERHVGDKIFVLDAQSAMHAMDNAVAVEIWRCLDQSVDGVTLGGVVGAIVERFDVPRDQAVADVLDFARLLHDRGILAPAD